MSYTFLQYQAKSTIPEVALAALDSLPGEYWVRLQAGLTGEHVTLTTIRKAPALNAAILAAALVDPKLLARVIVSDTRQRVKLAAARNPHVDTTTMIEIGLCKLHLRSNETFGYVTCQTLLTQLRHRANDPDVAKAIWQKRDSIDGYMPSELTEAVASVAAGDSEFLTEVARATSEGDSAARHIMDAMLTGGRNKETVRFLVEQSLIDVTLSEMIVGLRPEVWIPHWDHLVPHVDGWRSTTVTRALNSVLADTSMVAKHDKTFEMLTHYRCQISAEACAGIGEHLLAQVTRTIRSFPSVAARLVERTYGSDLQAWELAGAIADTFHGTPVEFLATMSELLAE